MTNKQQVLMAAIRDYAQNSLDGKCPDEGTNILSGLVNLADTCKEGLFKTDRQQAIKEEQLVELLLSHDNNNSYSI